MAVGWPCFRSSPKTNGRSSQDVPSIVTDSCSATPATGYYSQLMCACTSLLCPTISPAGMLQLFQECAVYSEFSDLSLGSDHDHTLHCYSKQLSLTQACCHGRGFMTRRQLHRHTLSLLSLCSHVHSMQYLLIQTRKLQRSITTHATMFSGGQQGLLRTTWRRLES